MSHKPIAAGKSSFDLIDFAAFMSVLDLSGEIVLLDVACGVGNYTIEIARQVREQGTVHALDLWEEGIAKLRLRAGSLGLENIETAIGDVSKTIPLDNDSVDICLMATVLHDLIEDDTHEGALAEVVRVLKPASLRLPAIAAKGRSSTIILSIWIIARISSPAGSSVWQSPDTRRPISEVLVQDY